MKIDIFEKLERVFRESKDKEKVVTIDAPGEVCNQGHTLRFCKQFQSSIVSKKRYPTVNFTEGQITYDIPLHSILSIKMDEVSIDSIEMIDIQKNYNEYFEKLWSTDNSFKFTNNNNK
jgi:hypothetical protein